MLHFDNALCDQRNHLSLQLLLYVVTISGLKSLKKVPKFWEFMPIFYYFFERISLQSDYAKIYFQILTLIFAYYNCCIIFPFSAFCAKVPFIRKLLFSMTSHLSFAPSFFLGIHFFHSLSLEKKNIFFIDFRENWFAVFFQSETS